MVLIKNLLKTENEKFSFQFDLLQLTGNFFIKSIFKVITEPNR